jgi:hypothetical protein
MGDEEVADLCVGGDLVVAIGEAMTLVRISGAVLS